MSAALRPGPAQYAQQRRSGQQLQQQEQHLQQKQRVSPVASRRAPVAAVVVVAAANKEAAPPSKPRAVQYGSDWYAATREAARPSTVREEIARRKAVNDVAYRDRRLNSDAWEGSEYKGSPFNILTLLAALFLLVPIAGLAFAYQSYGVLWG
jgi:hypothetical protein